MIYRLYNIKQNRYATHDDYIFLAIERNGRVAQVFPEVWNLTLAQQWKIQHGFKHSNGKCYYQNDKLEDYHSTYIIGFNGYSFYYTAKSKSTFYDVNYGGQRHDVGTYIISEQTNLW